VKRQEISDCELTADIVLGLMQDPMKYDCNGMQILEVVGPFKTGNNFPWVVIARTCMGGSCVVVEDTDIRVLVDDERAQIRPVWVKGWDVLELVEDK
jgi:hypothetical protein